MHLRAIIPSDTRNRRGERVGEGIRGARKEEKSPRGRLPIYPFLVRLVSLLRLSSLPDCLPSPAYRVPARPDKFRSLNLKRLATSARHAREDQSERPLSACLETGDRSRELSLLFLVFHPKKLVPKARIFQEISSFRLETWKIGKGFVLPATFHLDIDIYIYTYYSVYKFSYCDLTPYWTHLVVKESMKLIYFSIQNPFILFPSSWKIFELQIAKKLHESIASREKL